MANHERIEELLKHIRTLRGLVDYHKRILLSCGHCAMLEAGTVHTCDECAIHKVLEECPTVHQLNDSYLAALEESLRLLKIELDVECAKLQQL